MRSFVSSSPSLKLTGQLAVLFLQVEESISLVEATAEVVGRDLEETNGQFDCHRGEINCLKIREKDAKETVERLEGFTIGAANEAEVFKPCLDRMEDNVCKCGCTPSEVGEEFVSSEEEARTELSYASARGSKYVAPPLENPIPIPVPAPCHPCGFSTALPVTCLHSLRLPIRVLLIPPPLHSSIALTFTIE